MPIIGRHIIIPLLVFGFTVAVQLHAQPLPTDTLSGSNAKLKACANKECSSKLSVLNYYNWSSKFKFIWASS